MLTNLVGNAVKFTLRGNIVIAVECVSQEMARAMMRISVHDTGPGIPAGKLESVFEKFSQVDGSSTRKYGGTGLGLTISKQLVELMGGSITVRSRLRVAIERQRQGEGRWTICAICASSSWTITR